MNSYEHCTECGALTGRAGKHDDSLYCANTGPFCETCYEEWPEKMAARVAKLEQDLAYFPSTVRSLAETVTEREIEINQLRAELAATKDQMRAVIAECCEAQEELAEIKAQEPVACWLKSSKPNSDMVVLGNPVDIYSAATDVKVPLYAATVAKQDNHDWGVFAGYLLDKCEREVIYEESLQRWVSDIDSDPHYGPLFRREGQSATKQVVMPSKAQFDMACRDTSRQGHAPLTWMQVNDLYANMQARLNAAPGDSQAPAPVAKQVVMPERKPQRITDDYARGWNDYAAEYARLNAADQEGGQDE